MIEFDLQNLVNEYSLIGLSFIILVLASLVARFKI